VDEPIAGYDGGQLGMAAGGAVQEGGEIHGGPAEANQANPAAGSGCCWVMQ
jgi:hypothetical protein